MITQATVMLTAYTKLLKHIFSFFSSSLSFFLFRSNIYWHMEWNSTTELYNFQNVTLKEQIRWNGFIFISVDVNMDNRSIIIIIQSFNDNELNSEIKYFWKFTVWSFKHHPNDLAVNTHTPAHSNP